MNNLAVFKQTQIGFTEETPKKGFFCSRLLPCMDQRGSPISCQVQNQDQSRNVKKDPLASSSLNGALIHDLHQGSPSREFEIFIWKGSEIRKHRESSGEYLVHSGSVQLKDQSKQGPHRPGSPIVLHDACGIQTWTTEVHLRYCRSLPRRFFATMAKIEILKRVG